MGSIDRFVEPEPVRIPISDGDYIDIKKELNHGEREEMYARMSPYIVVGEERRLEAKEVRTSKVFAYLVGWSLTRGGKPVPMSLELPEQTRIDTINALKTATFDEIHAAIAKHESALVQAEIEKKMIHDGALPSSPISDSPSSAAGVTSGSVN